LARVIAAGPDHVSCYELTVEDGTPLHRSVAEGRVRVVEPETALRQHRIAVETLARSGYAQYEVSNFAREHHRCAHNLVYWRNQHYAAAGVGAHGHLPAALAAGFALESQPGALSFRYEHGRGVATYVTERRTAPLSVRGVEWIDAEMRVEETIMLGLRLREGVHLADDDAVSEARELAAAGFLELDGPHATVTPRGEEVLNQVALRLAHPG
ncbi:MAG TPA: hypothetical protein VLO10_06545, partial [Candidatus Deferrimicrobium sp.]|nr:hypothetical protein [Candidatus Deferrimicrobium sp.]